MKVRRKGNARSRDVVGRAVLTGAGTGEIPGPGKGGDGPAYFCSKPCAGALRVLRGGKSKHAREAAAPPQLSLIRRYYLLSGGGGGSLSSRGNLEPGLSNTRTRH